MPSFLKYRCNLEKLEHPTLHFQPSWSRPLLAVIHAKRLYGWFCCCCSGAWCARLFAIPWTAAHQTSLSFSVTQSLLKLMSMETMMPPNVLILCCSLLLLPSIFPNLRIFSNESVLHIRQPNCWSFSFSISSSNEIQG